MSPQELEIKAESEVPASDGAAAVMEETPSVEEPETAPPDSALKYQNSILSDICAGITRASINTADVRIRLEHAR